MLKRMEKWLWRYWWCSPVPKCSG